MGVLDDELSAEYPDADLSSAFDYLVMETLPHLRLRLGSSGFVNRREAGRVLARELDGDVFDPAISDVNEAAATHLTCLNELVVVPESTRVFEEPGALEHVALLAAAWFKKYVTGTRQRKTEA
jgi:hypothetical protein